MEHSRMAGERRLTTRIDAKRRDQKAAPPSQNINERSCANTIAQGPEGQKDHIMSSTTTSNVVSFLSKRELFAAQSTAAPTNIIPFEPVEFDDRDRLIFEVESMISNAVTGPAIYVSELAEMIVDEVLGDVAKRLEDVVKEIEAI
jgi:hypothetical protein